MEIWKFGDWMTPTVHFQISKSSNFQIIAMAKVTLSELEETLVNNREWILTKHTILQKVGELLAGQVDTINMVFIHPLIPGLDELGQCRPKISKGENYKGLPYMILDYPAIFSKTAVFALRTMFWWGNFFSVTLHLSGSYKDVLAGKIAQGFSGAGKGFYISTGEEWEHHFEEDNYVSAAGLQEEELYKKMVRPSFIKIALKYDLHQWNDIDELLKDAYSRFAIVLKP